MSKKKEKEQIASLYQMHTIMLNMKEQICDLNEDCGTCVMYEHNECKRISELISDILTIAQTVDRRKK